MPVWVWLVGALIAAAGVVMMHGADQHVCDRGGMRSYTEAAATATGPEQTTAVAIGHQSPPGMSGHGCIPAPKRSAVSVFLLVPAPAPLAHIADRRTLWHQTTPASARGPDLLAALCVWRT